MCSSDLSLRNVVLPNRLVLPAMVTRLSGEDGLVNDDIRARYVRFAKGGVGLIVLEAMAVHSAKSGPLLRISSDEFAPGLAGVALAPLGAAFCAGGFCAATVSAEAGQIANKP